MPLVSPPAGAMLSLTAPPAAPDVSEPTPAAPGLTLLDDVSTAPVVSVAPTCRDVRWCLRRRRLWCTPKYRGASASWRTCPGP